MSTSTLFTRSGTVRLFINAKKTRQGTFYYNKVFFKNLTTHSIFQSQLLTEDAELCNECRAKEWLLFNRARERLSGPCPVTQAMAWRSSRTEGTTKPVALCSTSPGNWWLPHKCMHFSGSQKGHEKQLKGMKYDTYYNKGEPWSHSTMWKNQTWKITYCIIQFVWNVQSKQICKTWVVAKGAH